MRIGIYNRWLNTLGGGERHSLAMAEFLSGYYPTCYISHYPVAVEKAAGKLNLDLSHISFKFLPEFFDLNLTEISRKYDFFINASNLDFFPSQAPKSALLVFFPISFTRDRLSRFKNNLALRFKQLAMIPSIVEGQPVTDEDSRLVIRSVNSKISVEVPAASQTLTCDFAIENRSTFKTRLSVKINGRILDSMLLPVQDPFVRDQVVLKRNQGEKVHRIEFLEDRPNDHPPANFDLIFDLFQLSHPRYALYKKYCAHLFKEYHHRFLRPRKFKPPLRESLSSYDLIWANSKFTSNWINSYWKRSSYVLYPPVNPIFFNKGIKKNIILNVGRFYAGSHHKNQSLLIDVFKEMVRQGLNHWEFHLAGGGLYEDIHIRQMEKNYLEELFSKAEGFPIKIHLDLPINHLVDLYGQSSIYWHATGYGQKENQAPIRMEHFGLTTVEAMASGCVPVVFGAGGQMEIVENNSNGFFWIQKDELKEKTWRLVSDSSLRAQLSEKASQDAEKFNTRNFNNRLQDSLAPIGI